MTDNKDSFTFDPNKKYNKFQFKMIIDHFVSNYIHNIGNSNIEYDQWLYKLYVELDKTNRHTSIFRGEVLKLFSMENIEHD
jgi:hypothetical protein